MSKQRSTWLHPLERKSPQTRRGQFRYYLRNNGFSPIEAREFSAYWRKYQPLGGGRKQYPPFLVDLVKERGAIKEAHNIEARAKGWGIIKSEQVYRERVIDIYNVIEGKHKNGAMVGYISPFVTKDKYWKTIPRRINPWALREVELLHAAQRDNPRVEWCRPPLKRKGNRSLGAQRFAKKQILDDIRVHDEQKKYGDLNGQHEDALLVLQFRLENGLY